MGSAPSGASSSTDCSELNSNGTYSFASIIHPDLVRLELRSSQSRGTIRELLELIHRKHPFDDLESVYTSLVERESVMSTGIGRGVALPHAVIPHIPGTYAAVGLSSKGISFESPDNVPVGVVVLVLFPEDAHREHIEILAGFSRLFRQEEFLSALRTVESGDELIDVLNRYEPLMEDHE